MNINYFEEFCYTGEHKNRIVVRPTITVACITQPFSTGWDAGIEQVEIGFQQRLHNIFLSA